MALVPRISSSSVTVNGSTWERMCPSSVATVTLRSVVPVVGMTSFDAEIRGRVSSFWSLGVPIFFHVDLDKRNWMRLYPQEWKLPVVDGN